MIRHGQAAAFHLLRGTILRTHFDSFAPKLTAKLLDFSNDQRTLFGLALAVATPTRESKFDSV